LLVQGPILQCNLFLTAKKEKNEMFAFDLIFLNGEDLRALPLIDRKARLKQGCAGNRLLCCTSITSMRISISSSRRSANSTWRAFVANFTLKNPNLMGPAPL